MQNDSINKIVSVYFASITNEPFEFNGRTYKPRLLSVSPTILRTAICPQKCAGCCPKFTLDYLPESKGGYPPGVQERWVSFNGKKLRIFTEFQSHNTFHFCKFVDKKSGLCKIHSMNPFSCIFEPLRFKRFTDPNHNNLLGCYPFGRGWSFKTVDGGKGAKCFFLERTSDETRNNVLQKLDLLQDWTTYFGLKNTKVPAIKRLIEKRKLTDKLIAV